MSALITGASGFIGGHLARRLREAGEDVIAPSSADLDLRDAARIEALFERHRITRVFHLAAFGVRAESDNVADVVQVNTAGSFSLARAALRQGVARFVYLGSGFEYQPQDRPIVESDPLGSHTLYGASKAAGWLLMDFLHREQGLPLVTLRPFTVYGPGESKTKLVPYVCLRALRREPMQLTAGAQVRDYLYVDDLIDALVLAADSAAPGSVYNLGAGPAQACPVREIVETIVRLAGAPASLCDFGTAGRTRRDPPYLVGDYARALAELGWRPKVSLEEGLSATLKSYQETTEESAGR